MTVEEILKLASEETALVIERLAAIPDALTALSLYADAANEAYWKRKDLHTAVALARAGIQHGLTASLTIPAAEPDRRNNLRGKVKALSYNLASFTWPGWDEQGITCDDASVAIGYDAAKLNLRLAKELNKGDLPMSRGLWMLGGHELCRKQYEVARGHFERASRHAQVANSAADEALGHAFAALTDVLEKPSDDALGARLERMTKQLGEVEEGPAFVQQVETAKKVFLK